MNARDIPEDGTTPEVTAPECAFRCIAEAGPGTGMDGDGFVIDGPDLDADHLRAAAAVVLPTQGAGRAAGLLASGARGVLLGEAALRDSSIVTMLAGEFGKERIGVYVPARRLEVRWSFDTVSNADFRVLTPSLGAPAWEVLLADGAGTGTQALWWIDAMLELGATQALLRVDIRDDADLNLCADCVERFGQRLWIGPLADEAPATADWIAFGHVRQMVLPPALLAAQAQAQATRLAQTEPAMAAG
ncbi:MAG TPA: hypothetical protein VFV55_11095 [Usitatibacteraceae bacterium]|nr:hypothetical protein [Usitatibacteraceae bacterium]